MSSLYRWLVTVLAVCGTGTVFSATVPYFTDFEEGVGPEWSEAVWDTSQPYHFTAFSGRFGTTNQTLTLTGFDVGEVYTVGFDLYVIDAWNNTQSVRVIIDEDILFDESFANSGTQTNPRQPDEGRDHLGFNSGNHDTIYRHLQVTFTAATATVEIEFHGINVGDIAARSWGLDNVSVIPADPDATPVIRSSTLPANEATVQTAIDAFSIHASHDLLATTATNAAHFELREAGPNGVFGDGDDTILTLTPVFSAGKSIRFRVSPQPLQPGLYRFQTQSGLQDSDGCPVAVFSRIFSVAHPTVGRIENTDNDLLVGATVMPMMETPPGKDFITGLGVGTLSAVGDVDYWSFSAEAGDRVYIRVETELGHTYPRLSLRNAADSNLQQVNGAVDGSVTIQNYAVGASGTYFARVWSDHRLSPYRIRVDRVSGSRIMETEANNTQATANNVGSYPPYYIAGALPGLDPDGDMFRIGWMNAGDLLEATIHLPVVSTLAASNIVLSAQLHGDTTDRGTTAGSLSYLAEDDGFYYLRVNALANRDIRALYLLDVTLFDTTPPIVTEVTLPDEGTTDTSLIDRFGVEFSEWLLASTVSESTHYDLRGAGPDGVFDTEDDDIYALSVSYDGERNASFRVLDGPLQAGPIRFTVSTNIQDRALNFMEVPYVRTFTVAGIDGFIEEGRTSDTVAGATSLSTNVVSLPAGSLLEGQLVATGVNPWDIQTADLNGNGYLDLVLGHSSGSAIHVHYGNGDGTFGAAVSFTTGSQPHELAWGDFNGNGHLDLAVADYGDHTLSILLNNGSGEFTNRTTYATLSQPLSVFVGDFNTNGFLDVAVANHNASSISILLGNGDGTFGERADIAVGARPYSVRGMDINGDGVLDLAVANYNSHTVSILLGNGDGTFEAEASVATGNNPIYAEFGDLNGNGIPDLAVSEYNTTTIAVFEGQGDGTFGPRVTYETGWYPRKLRLHDMTQNGWLDIVVAVESPQRVTILQNRGNGTFRAGIHHGTGSGTSPRALIVGDFNEDGIPDVAAAYHNSHQFRIWLGAPREMLPENPPDSGLRYSAGRGRRSHSSDVDHWSFYGEAGDWITIASENPGSPSSSGLRFQLIHPNGSTHVGSFDANSQGRGQMTPVQLPVSGRYTVRVSTWWDYQGEYRFRVTMVTPPTRIETEDNSSVAAANTPVYALTPGLQSATMVGYIGLADPNGDYFRIGNLGIGAEIQLTARLPHDSPLSPILQVYRDSTLVAAAEPGATNLNWVVEHDAYHTVRILADSGAGLMAQYLLDVDIIDAIPPVITALTLPAEGAVVDALIHSFSMTFSKDMTASTVTNAAHYDLRNAGPDGVFGTEDDEIYPVSVTFSGLTASFWLPHAPLQAGDYRFTVSTDVVDLFFNPLAEEYVRDFTVVEVEGWVTETLGSSDWNTAVSLGLDPVDHASGSLLAQSPVAMGGQAWGILVEDLDGSGQEDLVVTYPNLNQIRVFSGNGDATFTEGATYAGGGQPRGAALADLNGNGHLDLVVANSQSNTISMFTGNGDGTFGAPTHYPTDTHPLVVMAADFNGDGHLDLAVGNYNAASMRIFLNNGDGTFGEGVDYTVQNQPHFFAVADINGNGLLDIAVPNLNSHSVSFLFGKPDGTFSNAVHMATGNNPQGIVLADLNGNGHIDLAVGQRGPRTVSVWPGNGDGTFGEPQDYAVDRDPRMLIAVDLDQDGHLDLATVNQHNGLLSVLRNRGDGQFAPALAYASGGNPLFLAAGDFNGDGYPDLIVSNYDDHALRIFLGTHQEWLPEDSAVPGMRTGAGRGTLSHWNDNDFWSFHAEAGDRLMIAVEHPGSPPSSRLAYALMLPNGSTVHNSFLTDTSGRGQSDPIVLPQTGRYGVRVSRSQDYRGEYRFRVTTVPPHIQMEQENNNTVASGNTPVFEISPGRQEAIIAGYIGLADTSGDYFRIGNLGVDTEIRLTATLPDRSELVPVLQVYRDTTLVAAGDAGVTNFNWMVQEDGFYTVRILAHEGAGLFAQYVLDIVVADEIPPEVTALTLPAEGSTVDTLIHAFSMTLSKDMTVVTVTNSAHYDLRNAGPDGVFGTEDDEVYPVTVTFSGLTASFFLPQSPLQPGDYRFTISTNLIDRSLNPLPEPYIRNFTITGLDGFFTDTADNSTWNTALPLSLSSHHLPSGTLINGGEFSAGGHVWDIRVADLNGNGHDDLIVANATLARVRVFLGQGDATFVEHGTYPVGTNPRGMAVADFNGDGYPDVAVACIASHDVHILLGNGDGTFAVSTNYATGTQPLAIATGDFNNNGFIDLAVANYGSATVSILHNQGDGTFAAAVDYAVQSQPYDIAAADLNGNGRLDLAVANFASHSVSLLFGQTEGTFSEAVHMPSGNNPISLVLADFTGNSLMDLAVVERQPRTISVWPGLGDGSFGGATSYSISRDPRRIIAVDVDADGAMDLAVVSQYSNHLNILRNQGTGTFEPVLNYGVGAAPYSLAAGDFNGDGYPDIAVANYNGQSISLRLGTPRVVMAEADNVPGLRSAAGRGTISHAGDLDYFTFYGEAGHAVMIGVHFPQSITWSRVSFILYGPDGRTIRSYNSATGGQGTSPRDILPLTGRYVLRAANHSSDNYRGEYRFRIITMAPPTQLESESNNSASGANTLEYDITPGLQHAVVAGYVAENDTSGDYFRIGFLGEDTEIRLNVVLPEYSSLVPKLWIYRDSALKASSEAGDTNLVWTTDQDGTYNVRITAEAGGGLFADYVLTIEAVDETPPEITSCSLPADGTSTPNFISSFTVGFSKDLSVATVTNRANYDLRSAGPDGVFGTADDDVYDLSISFSGGFSATYTIQDAPLQVGDYRFTIASNLTDRALNTLTSDYVRTFSVTDVDGFIEQRRGSDTIAGATSLSLEPAIQPAGSLVSLASFGTGTNPTDIHVGRFNDDEHDDLLVVNRGANTLTILLGNGDGTFTTSAVYAAASPYNAVLGDFNGDGHIDIAAVNHDGNKIGIWLGQGDGTFTEPVEYDTGTQPLDVAAVDLNDNGILDLVVGDYGGHTISVLFGDGDGAFAAPVQYSVANGPSGVAVGDINGNELIDIVVSSYSSSTLSVFEQQVDGTFLLTSTPPVGSGCIFVALEDLNGNGILDVVVSEYSAHTVSVLHGHGDGTFADRISYAVGNHPRRVRVRDMNGDGHPDILVVNLSPNTLSILLNRGDGTFEPRVDYAIGADPFSLTIGDFNSDGWLDVATANYAGHGISILLGQGRDLLTGNPPDSGRWVSQVRGRLVHSGDIRYWSFYGEAGQQVSIGMENPGFPYWSRINYAILHPGGAVLQTYTMPAGGRGQSPPVVLPASGRYLVRVTRHTSDNYLGEYRFRLFLTDPELQQETEANNTIATANTVTLEEIGENHRVASVTGYLRVPDDLDYFALGTLSNGMAVLLTARIPSGSDIEPIVGVYDSTGMRIDPAPGSSPGVAEVWIQQTGDYVALMRGAGATGGLTTDYIMDIQILPADDIPTPNLQVTAVVPPTAPDIVSGDPITFTWVVSNTRPSGTGVSLWYDRVVMSPVPELGAPGEILLGEFPRHGALAGESSYTNTQTVTLPHGISGAYYLIVFTDSGNAVYESMLEWDNVTASDETFHVAMALYPDLVVEGLTVTPIDEDTGEFRIEWITANRGFAAVDTPFHERVVVTYLPNMSIVLDVERPFNQPLAVDAEWPHTLTAFATRSGPHRIQVTTDSRNAIYEFDGISHESAEQNTVQVETALDRYYVVATGVQPAGTGSVEGGGRLPGGSSVTVTAIPDTSELPYLFERWTEGGSTIGTNASLAFTLTQHRALTAHFRLPQHNVTLLRSPAAGGSVSGAGTYTHGAICILTASPNAGYGFTGWYEGAVLRSELSAWTTTVTSAHTFTAVFYELNPEHDVTTATLPADLAVVTGAGLYTNQQVGVFGAPLHVTNNNHRFTFHRYTLNDAFFSLAREFSRTFTTVDPPTMHFVAEYTGLPLDPQVIDTIVSHSNNVPVTTNYTVTLVFDRAMDTTVEPALTFSNAATGVMFAAPTNGVWQQTHQANDTYRMPGLAIGAGMDGIWTVTAAEAVDLFGFTLVPTNVWEAIIDTVPPAAPVVNNYLMYPATNILRSTSVVLQGERDDHTEIWIDNILRVPLGTGAWTFARSGLTQGAHEWSLYARSAIGNLSDTNRIAFWVDSVAPSITAVFPPNNATTNAALPFVRITYREVTSGLDEAASSFTVSGPPGVIPGDWAVTSTTLVFTADSAWVDGPYTIQARLVDGAGNTGTLFNAAFVIDSTPPTPPIINPVTSPTTINQQTLTGWREAQTAILVDGIQVVAPSSALNWSWTTPLVEGDNHFAIAARAASGNVSEAVPVLIVYTNVPPGPVALTAQVHGVGTQITLGWSGYNELLNGGDIAGYRVYAAAAAFTHIDDAEEIGQTAAGVKHFLVTGLTRGVTRHYAVVAFDDTDQANPQVTSLAAAPVDVVPPGNPVGLQVMYSGADELHVEWTAPGDSDLAGYRVYFNNDSNAIPRGLDERFFAATDLAAATAYPVRVTSIDADNNESAGSTIQGVTWMPHPTNIITSAFDAQVTLSWDAVQPTAYVQRYHIYTAATEFVSIAEAGLVATTSATTFTVTGLVNNVAAHFAVATENISGGIDPAVISLSAMPEADEDGPEFTSILWNGDHLTTDHVLTARGTLTATASDPSGVARMELWLGNEVDPRRVTSNTTTLAYAWDIANDSDGPVAIRIRAVDSKANESTWTGAVTIALAPPTALPTLTAPAHLTLTNAEDTLLQGTVPHIDDTVRVFHNGVLLGEPVVQPNRSFSWTVPLNEGANSLSAALYNRAGQGSLTPALLVTAQRTPPAAPVLVQATARSGGEILVVWQRCSLTTLAGFNLYRAAAPFTSTSDAVRVNSALYTITQTVDLPVTDGEWHYRVTAVDLAGNESALSVATSAVSDRTGPLATSITYTPQGAYDAGIARFGVGPVQVDVHVNEPLLLPPYLSWSTTGGGVLNVTLTKLSDLHYRGTLNIVPSTPSGMAYAAFSARDLLGNRGTVIYDGHSFLIDTDGPYVESLAIQPFTPIENPVGEPANVQVTINLSEAPAAAPELWYQLSTSATNPVPIDLAAGAGLSWVGTFTLPPDAGQPMEWLQFTYAGVDDLGNVGTAILGENLFEVYQGDLPATQSPFGLTARSLPDGYIELGWNPVPNAAAYCVYRRASGQPDFALLVELEDEEEWLDLPPTDGTYQYALASVRRENEQESESPLSTIVSAVSDRVAPYPPSNLQLELLGSGIRLDWDAPPFTEPVQYRVYRAGGLEITNVNEAVLLGQGLTVTSIVDPYPSPTQSVYTVTAVDYVGNESAPAPSQYLNVALLPVSSITVDYQQGGYPVLNWTHGRPAGLSYAVEINGQRVTGSGYSATWYPDAGYNAQAREYAIIAVDAAQQESLPRTIRLPRANVRLLEADVRRGALNQLVYEVSAVDELRNALLRVSIGSHTNISQGFTLVAGATQTVHVVIGGRTTMTDVSPLRSVLECRPNEGELIRLIQQSSVPVGDASFSAEVYSEGITRGIDGRMRFAFWNNGVVDAELRIARNYGNANSPDMRYRLVDRDGNIYVQGAIRLPATGGDVYTLANGDVVARVTPDGAFMSGTTEFRVPYDVPETLELIWEVDRIYHRSGFPDQTFTDGLRVRREVTLHNPVYDGMVTNVSPASSNEPTDFEITGIATWDETGLPAADQPLRLVVSVRGFERVYSVTTDSNGEFRHIFRPEPIEHGVYQVWAIHPDRRDKPLQASFSLQRVWMQYSSFNLRVPQNHPYTLSVWVEAGGLGIEWDDLALVALAEDQPGGELPAAMTFTPATGATLTSGRRVTLRPTVSFSEPGNGTVHLRFATGPDHEEVRGMMALHYTVEVVNPITGVAEPAPFFTTSFLEAGVTQGEIANRTIFLENRGLGTLNEVELELRNVDGTPAPGWISLGSAPRIPSIAPGARSAIMINLMPTEFVAQGDYQFRLRAASANGPTLNYNIYVTVTTDAVGNLLFKVTDIYTGVRVTNGEIEQGVYGARVRIQNEAVATIQYEGYTDRLGEWYLPDLPAGAYRVRVTSAGHDDYGTRVVVRSGETTSLEVPMHQPLVTVQFEVVPISLTDRYEIRLVAVFETEVPAPVVTIEPLSLTLPDMREGEVFNGQYRLVNHGLIRAEDVEWTLPAPNAYYRVEILGNVPDVLEAKQELIVPFRVIALQSFTEEEANDSGSSGRCIGSCHIVRYHYYCSRNNEYRSAIQSCVYIPCRPPPTSSVGGSGGAGPWWGWGGGGGAGGGGTFSPGGRIGGGTSGTWAGGTRPAPRSIAGACECECDADCNGVADSCFQCNNNTECFQCDTTGNGCPDSCYTCPSVPGGPLNTCFQCDTTGDFVNDSCFVCPSYEGGPLDSCYRVDTTGDGIPDACYACPITEDNPLGLYTCDTTGDGILDSCYTCDTTGDGIPDSCYTCRSDGDPEGLLDSCYCIEDGEITSTCGGCPAEAALRATVELSADYTSQASAIANRINSALQRIPYVSAEFSVDPLVVSGQIGWDCCGNYCGEPEQVREMSGRSGIGVEASFQAPFFPGGAGGIGERRIPGTSSYTVKLEWLVGMEVTVGGSVSIGADYEDACGEECFELGFEGRVGVELFVGGKGEAAINRYGEPIVGASVSVGASGSTSVTANGVIGFLDCEGSRMQICWSGFTLEVPATFSFRVDITQRIGIDANFTYMLFEETWGGGCL